MDLYSNPTTTKKIWMRKNRKVFQAQWVLREAKTGKIMIQDHPEQNVSKSFV
jgi:hypothetical protein